METSHHHSRRAFLGQSGCFATASAMIGLASGAAQAAPAAANRPASEAGDQHAD